MSPAELRNMLDDALAGDAPHVEKLTVSGAVISEMASATRYGGNAGRRRRDRIACRDRLRAEDAEDALGALRALGADGKAVGAVELEGALAQLHPGGRSTTEPRHRDA